MPGEEFQTINTEFATDSSSTATPDTADPADAGGTSSPTDDNSGGQSSAQNGKEGKDGAAIEAKAAKSEKAPPKDEKPPEGEDGSGDDKLPRFDQHPDWQRMKDERNEAVAREKALLAQLRATPAPQERQIPEAEARDYNSELMAVNKQLEDGDLSLSEHALKTQTILRAQMKEERAVELQQLRGEQHRSVMESTFYQAYPEYMELMQSGKLQEITAAAKAKSPLHDEVSAYFAYKAEQAEATAAANLKVEVDKARKAEREKTIKEIQRGAEATTLDGSTGSRPPPSGKDNDERIKNTDKFGGEMKVLAERHAERQRQRQGLGG